MVAIAGIIAGAWGVGAGEVGAQPMGIAKPGSSIEEVLKARTPGLMSVPGVVGTAQSLCDGKPCIKVYVIRKTSALGRKIPANLEGYPVVIEETGEIKALSKERP
jgi:hypothetical protein